MRQFAHGLLFTAFILAMLGIANPHPGFDAAIAVVLSIAFAINVFGSDADWREGYQEGFVDAAGEMVDLDWLANSCHRNTAAAQDAVRAMKYLTNGSERR
jgi:hypothetical protein